ncbi:hypothetical protein CXQ82_15370 [Pseudomonas sp. S09G 359]|nr:hypothetical protein CXQ82_15370 [Pseudomonas sp. S09G 359]
MITKALIAKGSTIIAWYQPSAFRGEERNVRIYQAQLLQSAPAELAGKIKVGIKIIVLHAALIHPQKLVDG